MNTQQANHPHNQHLQTEQAGSNLGGNTEALSSVLHDSPLSSPHTATPSQNKQKRIPKGVVTGEIPLEAAKSYPLRIWTGTGLEPRIAYADLNSKGEKNTLSVKLIPEGAKGAEHPQIVLFVNGMYHVEELGYTRSNPWEWTTWLEVHIDAKNLQAIIDALYKAKFELEALP